MGDHVQLSTSHVYQAVKDEVQLWRNLQIGAIRGFNSSNLPYLSEKPAIFQAAAWFGLGMDTVGKFAASSAAAKLMTRAAVPLVMLDFSTRYFAQAYSKLAQEQKLILTDNAETFKSKLIDGISQAERQFYTDQAYGIPLQDKLFDLVKQDRFSDKRLGSRFIRKILLESGAVVTRNDAISRQTKAALEKVAKVVEHIYRVSKYGPTAHKQLKHSNSSGPFKQSDFNVSNCRLTKDLLATMKPGETVSYLNASRRNPMGVQGHPRGDKFDYIADEKKLNEILLNAWRYESKHGQGGGFNQCHATWVWQASKPVDSGYLASTYKGSLNAVEQAYRQLRSQYVAA